MTATLIPQAEQVDARSVNATLSLVHDQWMERIARLLAPPASPRATFWERWGAVRFLSDQFEDRFRLECDLAESLAGQLSPSVRVRLHGARAAVERSRSDLMAAGRRRGTAAQVALLCRRFLDQARRWCATLELATAGLAIGDLPPESRTMLARLRTAAGLGL